MKSFFEWNNDMKAWHMKDTQYPICSYCKLRIEATPFHICPEHKKIFCGACMYGSRFEQKDSRFIPAFCHNRHYLSVFNNAKAKDAGRVDCMYLQVKRFELIGAEVKAQ